MRFVVLGDLHYSIYPGKKLADMRDEFYFRLFDTVKKVQPDVVFAIGDVSHSSRVEELEGIKAIASRAGIEFDEPDPIPAFTNRSNCLTSILSSRA